MTGDIPIIHIKARTLPEAWHESITTLLEEGCRIRTEYDKPNDPLSYDSTAIIEIAQPCGEPMIHRDFPDSLKGLGAYANEILHGTHDDKYGETYTYHRRLFAYEEMSPLGTFNYNQIKQMIEKLAEAPHSRRAQAITWKVQADINDPHAPCLQSIWCRALRDDLNCLRLNMNVRIRSNDAYKAAFMNMFAFIMLQKKIALDLSEMLQETVLLGRYCHMADSYHIYGKDLELVANRRMQNRPWEQMTWRYADVKSKLNINLG